MYSDPTAVQNTTTTVYDIRMSVFLRMALAEIHKEIHEHHKEKGGELVNAEK